MRNLWAFIVLVFLASPALAQQQPPIGPPQVLIVDSDRLYFETQYGLRLARDLAAQQAAVQQENDRIVATLTEEER
ncbi:MAG: OmpH family outer membrane protein, partial [Pseudomonadota bacterium]